MKKKQKVVKVMEWLNNGCYPGFVMFSCGFTYDQVVAELKKKKATDWLYGIQDDKKLIESGNWFGLARYVENTKTGSKMSLFYIIITEEFKFDDYDYCRLAHEVLHICQFFLKDLFDMEREYESVAYYHTHIMQQCLKALRV